MNKYFFWNGWSQPYRGLTSFLFGLLLFFVATSIVLLVIGPENLIGWHTFSQLFPVDVVTQTVDVGPFNFPFPEQLFVIKEFMSGGNIPVYVWAGIANLLIIMSMFSMFITIITYFNRIGFLAFAGLIFTFIVFLHPEMLKIAGLGDKWVLGMMFLLFAGPAYYFQAYNKNASFVIRLMVSLAITILFLVVAVSLSNVISPLQALMNYGILAPYLVVLLFVLMVGHEIVNGFLMGIAGNKDKEDNNRIKHFLVITVIYLANVLLSYLEVTHVIHWGIITINPFVMLGLAAILGVWGVSQRYMLYEKVAKGPEVWVLLYLVIAVLSYGTITYLMLSMEDPMLKIISDFIIFTQLSLGFAFMVYILYNFIPVIEKGYAMKGILYKPLNLPHATYRLVGVVILTALVLMRDIKYPIWYSLGGFYNSIADYFYANDDMETATIFYEKGADLSKNNHKSNYKLGMINIDSDHDLAIKYFKNASSRVPTPQAFINQANLESDEGRYFEALFTLQKGEKELGESVEIQSNLGLQFSKAGILDSAWYYYNKAEKAPSARNNALAFVLENNFTLSANDSLWLFKKLDNVGKANATALGWRPKVLEDISGDDMISASMLNNLMVNKLPVGSSSLLNTLSAIVDSTKNADFSEELSYTLALYEMRNGHVSDALSRLQKLVTLASKNQSKYFEVLGLINLKNRSYNEASTFFYLAEQAGSKSAIQPLALAQTESGYFDEALQTWSRAEESDNETLATRARIMKRVINSVLNGNDSINGDDLSLYLKARYQRLWVDEYSVKSTFDRIQDKSLKNQLALDLATYYFESGNMQATKMFYEIIDPTIAKQIILRPLLYLNIRLAYAGLIPDLKKQLDLFHDAGFEFDASEQLQKVFFETNRQDIPADIAERLATDDPYFAEGIVWASQFYESDTNTYRSYNIVQEALDKNPDNRLLLEDYILRAIDLGLDNYADQSLMHYRELYPGEQFNQFVRLVNARKAAFNEFVEDD